MSGAPAVLGRWEWSTCRIRKVWLPNQGRGVKGEVPGWAAHLLCRRAYHRRAKRRRRRARRADRTQRDAAAVGTGDAARAVLLELRCQHRCLSRLIIIMIAEATIVGIVKHLPY